MNNPLTYEVYDDGNNLWVVSNHSIRYEDIKANKKMIYSSEVKYGSTGVITYVSNIGLKPYHEDTSGYFEIYV